MIEWEESMFDFVVINATRIISGERMRILRNVAATQLRKRQDNPTTFFEHEFCAGTITRKDEGVYGTFGGTFFQADLGTVDGERLIIDFLIPRNTEWRMIDDAIEVFSGRPLPDGDYGVKKVDTSRTESIRIWTS